MNPQKTRSKKFNQTEKEVQSLKKVQPYKGILGSGKTSSKLKLTMWNVNGIRSVLSKYAMRDFIAKYNPDFICINETKINEQLYAKEKLKIKEYNDYWNFCKCSAGYSGVAIFAKYEPISIFEDLEEPEYSQEGRVLTLEYQLFYLVVVYMPTAGMKKPGQKELERLEYKTQKYQKAFHRYCQKLKQKGKGVIVCGDFNVSLEEIDIHVTPNTHKQPGFTAEQRTSFKSFLNKGWVDTFRKLHPTQRAYTWWRIEHNNREKNIGKRLDYFLVNTDFFKYVKKAEVLGEVMGSDHCPIFLQLNFAPSEKKLQQTAKQSQKSKNQEKHNIEQPETTLSERLTSKTDEKSDEKVNDGKPTAILEVESQKRQNDSKLC